MPTSSHEGGEDGWIGAVSGLCRSIVSYSNITPNGAITLSPYYLVMASLPIAYLAFVLYHSIVHRYKQALWSGLNPKRDYLPIYVSWIQLLLISAIFTGFVSSVNFSNGVADQILKSAAAFVLSIFDTTLIFFLHFKEITKWTLRLSMLLGFIAASVQTLMIYFTFHSSLWYGPKTKYANLGRFILTMCLALLYSVPLFLRFTPYLSRTSFFSRFHARDPIYLFIFVLVLYFLITSLISGLAFFDVDFGFCVDCVKEIVIDLCYYFAYIRACQRDSYLWYTRNKYQSYFTFEKQAEQSDRSKLLRSISTDWQIPYTDLEFQEVIGRGAKGVVRKGVYCGTEVAIKIIYQDFSNNNNNDNNNSNNDHKHRHSLSQFHLEVKLLTTLHHPNIILFMGTAAVQSSQSSSPVLEACIVMELMGYNLYNIIHDSPQWWQQHHTSQNVSNSKSNSNSNINFMHTEQSIGEITLREKFLILRSIARGMYYLHTRNPCILHRDLKSGNILCGPGWRRGDQVKISDFGISQKLVTTPLNSPASKTNSFSIPKEESQQAIGTACWAAPEVIESGEFSEGSDVYSFGMVMWEMMTREEVYDKLGVFEILMGVPEGLRPEIPDYVPVWGRKMMQDCWEKEPGKRPGFESILERMEVIAKNKNKELTPELECDGMSVYLRAEKGGGGRNIARNHNSNGSNGSNGSRDSKGKGIRNSHSFELSPAVSSHSSINIERSDEETTPFYKQQY